MSNHPIAPEDELVSLADAALTAAEADAAAPNSPLIFRPEWRPEPRTRSSVTQPAPATRAFSWASLVKDQLSRAGLHHDQPLPTHPASPSSTASAESPPTASATSASTTSPPSTASAASSPIPGSTAPPPQDAVAELVKRNQKAFDKVVNHPFPRALGEGTASLDGFRYYMIQDWLYLRTCTQLKFLALGSGSYGKQVEEFDVRYKVEYTNKLAETCRTMLGIPESTMEATGRSGELDASEHVYRKVLQDNNAWLGYYVVLLPCVMTYGEIAQRLVHNPSTAKNVVYHRAWTEVNYNDSSLKKYIKFVNENIAAQGGVDEWSWAFNVACLLESQLFDIGLEAPVHPYEIIPNGTYSIHTSSANNLVLAVQDVTHFLRPPAAQVLGGYLPSDTRSSVVGMEKMGGDNEKWLIFATKTGYTFKNVGTGLYLGMSTAPDRAQYRILQAVSDPYCWWVNPSSKQPDQGPSAYQIHDSLNLRYTLHAAIEALNSIASTDLSFTPITAHENSEAPCQMWSFDNYNFKQPERTQTHADDHQPTEQRPTEPAEQLREADATIKQLEAERDLLRKDLEKVRLALNVDESKIPTGIELSAMIRSLANEHESQMRYLNDDLTQTRKLLAEESARLLPLETWERKKRTYICYWQPFSPSLESKFDSATFNPAPIEFGNEEGCPTFIVRHKLLGDVNQFASAISDGWPLDAHDVHGIYTYEVLVGDSSSLSWIPIDESWIKTAQDGPPKVKSLVHKPVTGWNIGLSEYNDAFMFFGRFTFAGKFLAGQVMKGYLRPIGLWRSPEFLEAEPAFEVLCYNSLKDAQKYYVR